VAATDNVVEHEADAHPRYVVQRRRRRNEVDATKEYREIEIPKETHLIFLLESPLDKRGNSPGQEEEEEGVVQLTVREYTTWSNDTPLSRKKH
jgi:hypothetical protein